MTTSSDSIACCCSGFRIASYVNLTGLFKGSGDGGPEKHPPRSAFNSVSADDNSRWLLITGLLREPITLAKFWDL